MHGHCFPLAAESLCLGLVRKMNPQVLLAVHVYISHTDDRYPSRMHVCWSVYPELLVLPELHSSDFLRTIR